MLHNYVLVSQALNIGEIVFWLTAWFGSFALLLHLVCTRPCLVSFQPIVIHREVSFAADPAFVLLNQEAADQAVDARFVGEDVDDTFAPPDLINQGSSLAKLVS